jgi:hypothetical protein
MMCYSRRRPSINQRMAPAKTKKLHEEAEQLDSIYRMVHKVHCFIANYRALTVATSNYRGLLMEQITERAYVHNVKKAYLLFKELGPQNVCNARSANPCSSIPPNCMSKCFFSSHVSLWQLSRGCMVSPQGINTTPFA